MINVHRNQCYASGSDLLGHQDPDPVKKLDPDPLSTKNMVILICLFQYMYIIFLNTVSVELNYLIFNSECH